MHRLRREKSGLTVVIHGEKIKCGKLIGKGGFGSVYQASHADWGDVAVKKFSDADDIPDKEKRKLESEAEKMWELSHNNITRIYGIMLEKNMYCIVLEYMCHKSMTEFIDDYQVPFPLKGQIIFHIILGMNYLHTREPSILHLDLKGMNVLIDDNFNAKICDFGLSQWRSFSERYSIINNCGTATHIPPERWRDINETPNAKFDVYSFGILLWELLSEKEPFQGSRTLQISNAVMHGQRPNEKELPDQTPPLLLEILKLSWHQQPEKRPTFGDLKNSYEDFYKRKYDGDIPDAKINLLHQVKRKSERNRQQVFAQEQVGQGEGQSSRSSDPQTNGTDHRVNGSSVGTISEIQGALSTVEIDGSVSDKRWDASSMPTLPEDDNSLDGSMKAERTPVQRNTSSREQSGEQESTSSPSNCVDHTSFPRENTTNPSLPQTISHQSCDLEVDGIQSMTGYQSGVDHSIRTNTVTNTSLPIQKQMSEALPMAGSAGVSERRPMQRATETQEFSTEFNADLRYKKSQADRVKNMQFSTHEGQGQLPNREDNDDIEVDGEPLLQQDIPEAHRRGVPFTSLPHGQFQNQYVPAAGGYYFYPQPNGPPVFIPDLGGHSSLPPRFPPPPRGGTRMPHNQESTEDPHIQYSGRGTGIPNVIRHQSSSGANTTIYSLKNMEGVQIGNKNVMYIGGKPKSGKRRIIKAKITDSLRQINRQDMEIIAEHLGSSWKKVARRLSFSDGQIDAIESDHHVRGLKETIYQMLLQWKTKEGKDASAKAIADLLCSMGKADIAAMLSP